MACMSSKCRDHSEDDCQTNRETPPSRKGFGNGEVQRPRITRRLEKFPHERTKGLRKEKESRKKKKSRKITCLWSTTPRERGRSFFCFLFFLFIFRSGGGGSTATLMDGVADAAARRILIPSNCSEEGHDPEDCFAVVLDDVLSASECKALRDRADPHFRIPSDVRSDDGSVVPLKFAPGTKYGLVVHHDPITAAEFWRRIEPRISAALGAFTMRTMSGPPQGVCPRLRVLRYFASEGHRFMPHFDRVVAEDDGRRSLLTILIYLNDGNGDDFHGGETCFLDTAEVAAAESTAGHQTPSSVPITPKAGRVVVFEHGLFHCGSPLHSPEQQQQHGDDTPTEKAAAAAAAAEHQDSSDRASSATEPARAGASSSPRNAKYVLRTDVLFGFPSFGKQASKETALEAMMRAAYDNVEEEDDGGGGGESVEGEHRSHDDEQEETSKIQKAPDIFETQVVPDAVW